LLFSSPDVAGESATNGEIGMARKGARDARAARKRSISVEGLSCGTSLSSSDPEGRGLDVGEGCCCVSTLLRVRFKRGRTEEEGDGTATGAAMLLLLLPLVLLERERVTTPDVVEAIVDAASPSWLGGCGGGEGVGEKGVRVPVSSSALYSQQQRLQQRQHDRGRDLRELSVVIAAKVRAAFGFTRRTERKRKVDATKVRGCSRGSRS
jgi:hypothetical protein